MFDHYTLQAKVTMYHFCRLVALKIVKFSKFIKLISRRTTM